MQIILLILLTVDYHMPSYHTIKYAAHASEHCYNNL